jgi:cell wall-associated NlpC family hydrolase
MWQNRRSFLLTLLAAPVAMSARLPSAVAQTESGKPSPTITQLVSDFPDPKTLQSGDFVWPKKKGAFVPRYRIDQPPSEEQKAWEAARERLLREDPSKSGLSPELAEKLKSMSYEEFETRYFAGPAETAGKAAKSRSVNIGGQTIYVGHVGIVEIDAQGIPYVVEAAASVGLRGAVIRTPYADWLKNNSGMRVWHGRVRDLRAGVRKRIVTEAMKQLGKPYEFFNFDLNDDSGFYCSKLAWMSVWRATSSRWVAAPIAVDDDPNPRRPFFSWFSPKQLVNAKRVTLLHKPGEY